ncbi:hypothetical protein AGRA3207_007382 [Actinomadura graeca]|uniref:Uncharacterized protein n=1 Tax=Actinomadura graeca TaxID=2750812 RepID=A0ABX8R416_9ACTN|nr:hypothetical protein [Actinomadura graeca]QXJ25825.1 hypothetical protein AGRA3207_007382 [Actinomadura graeca]
MTDGLSPDPRYAEWRKLPPAKQAQAWEKIRPGTFEEIWAEALKEGKHRRYIEVQAERHRMTQERAASQHMRRVSWFAHGAQTVRIIFAFCSLIITAYAAQKFIRADASQGVMVYAIGGGTTVALFLGLRPAALTFLGKGHVKGIEDSNTGDST